MATKISFIGKDMFASHCMGHKFRLEDGENFCEVNVSFDQGMQISSHCGNVTPYAFRDVIQPRQAGACALPLNAEQFLALAA